jgi:lysophospholipase L1-like esterase
LQNFFSFQLSVSEFLKRIEPYGKVLAFSIFYIFYFNDAGAIQNKKKAKSTHSRKQRTKPLNTIPLRFTDSPEFIRFCEKAQQLKAGRTGNLNLFILGDSHMQCEDFGQGLCQYLGDSLLIPNAGRGFAFPYPLANTSHRSENKFWPNNQWKGCRFTKESNSCDWGLAGWTAHCGKDSVAFFWSQGERSFSAGDEIGLFSPERCANSHRVFLDDSTRGEIPMVYDSANGGFWSRLNFSTPKVKFRIQRVTNDSADFVVQGILARPVSSGFVCGISGTNGARLDHYLLNPDFPRHLRIMNPDLLIIALGTNEAFSPNFSPENVRKSLYSVLIRIKSALPEAAIILIGPPDHKHGRKSNPRIAAVNQVFAETAEELDFTFWNLQKAMGGNGAIFSWRKKGLATKDMVHFTPAGYRLQAKLFGSSLKPFFNLDQQ